MTSFETSSKTSSNKSSEKGAMKGSISQHLASSQFSFKRFFRRDPGSKAGVPRKPLPSYLRDYVIPVVVSLFLHLLLLAFLTRHSDSELRIVPPQSLSASLVELPQPAPVQQPAPRPQPDDAARISREQAERQRQEALRRQQREREIALQKQKEAEAREAREMAQREAEQRAKQERQRKAEEQRQRKLAEQRRRQQEDLRQRLEQEQRAREQAQAAAQAEQEVAEVAHYIRLFSRAIIPYWNRPPSARNNMTALLQVALSPQGDLLEVRLLEGSGNDAFDRAAIQAVQRAAPFPELQALDRRIFDSNFRRFNFRFRPEDLVR